MLRKLMIYTPREVVECIVLGALFSAPMWLGPLLDRT